MSKKDSYYFENFVECAACACEAAEILQDTMVHFDLGNMEEQMHKLHAVENRADMKKHELIAEIVKAFVTPIEREDILKLSQYLDDVTDSVEDISIHLYADNITSVRKEAPEFARIVLSCCVAMKNMLVEFKDFRKSKALPELLKEINTLEEEGDRLYLKSMRRLHTEENDPMEVIRWREIILLFEKTCDACEHVADVVEGIVIGNL